MVKRKSTRAGLASKPKIHVADAVPGMNGVVTKVAEIEKQRAIAQRQAGRDVVVCGDDIDANRSLAREIEESASGVGQFQRHEPHPRAGPDSLPHYQPKSRPPAGHTFYETERRKARRQP